MARRRSFHPEFWSSKKLKKLYIEHGPESVLFYGFLFTYADDEGRGYVDESWVQLKAPLLDLGDKPVMNWFDTCNELGLIVEYNEKSFYFLPDWFEKQSIPKPYPSEIPLPNKELLLKNYNYSLALLKQLGKILQRLKNEGKITNQLLTSIKLVKNRLSTSKAMKLKEVKGKEVKGNLKDHIGDDNTEIVDNPVDKSTTTPEPQKTKTDPELIQARIKFIFSQKGYAFTQKPDDQKNLLKIIAKQDEVELTDKQTLEMLDRFYIYWFKEDNSETKQPRYLDFKSQGHMINILLKFYVTTKAILHEKV